MPYYLAEVRDSDGNDCTVLDVLMSAPTRGQAFDRLWQWVDKEYPDDEHDGSAGTYHTCDCECEHSRLARHESYRLRIPHSSGDGICADCTDSWECSHGGLLLPEYSVPEMLPEFATYKEARAAHTTYHTLVDLTDDEETV